MNLASLVIGLLSFLALAVLVPRRWLQFILLPSLALVWSSGLTTTPLLSTVNPFRVVLLSALAQIALARQRIRPPLPQVSKHALWAIAAWVGLLASEYALAPTPGSGSASFLSLTVDFTGILLVLVLGVRSISDIWLATRSVVVSVTALSGLAVYEFAANRVLLDLVPNESVTYRSGHVRAHALFQHPILMGLAAALAIVLIWSYLRYSGRGGRHWRLAVVALLVNAAAAYATGSRLAWLCAAVGIAFLEATYRKWPATRSTLSIGAVFISMLLVVSPIVGPLSVYSGTTALQTEQQASIAYRVALARATFLETEPGLTGFGFEQFDSRISIGGTFQGRYFDFTETLDNTFAWAYVRFGVVGLLALGISILACIRLSVRGATAASRNETHAMHFASLSASFSAMTLALPFVALLSFQQGVGMYALFIGLMVSASRFWACAQPRAEVQPTRQHERLDPRQLYT